MPLVILLKLAVEV